MLGYLSEKNREWSLSEAGGAYRKANCDSDPDRY